MSSGSERGEHDTTTLKELTGAICRGKRVSPSDAMRLLSLPLPLLGALGDDRRRRVEPHGNVGYIVDRIINYSNRCTARCTFCAYHADAGVLPEFDLGIDEILTKIAELVEAGGTQVMLQGGLHPSHPLAWYLDLVGAVKDAFPDIHLHSFSPSEIVHIAGRENLDYTPLIERLRLAGLDSVPGASDLLVDAVRSRVSPRKCTRDQWRDVIRAIAANGMVSSATMTYGMGETLEERVEHLRFIRETQDETGAFQAFIPWSFSPANTGMAHVPQAGGIAYLRTVALSRIFLDNIPHLQAGWLTEGVELAQLALGVGADDMGGVLTEERVLQATDVQTRVTVPLLEDLIRNAGKTPVRRDSRYRPLSREEPCART